MEKQRWLTFFLIVFAVTLFFQVYIFKPAPPTSQPAKMGAETPGTGTEASPGAASRQVEEAKPSPPAELEPPGVEARDVVVQTNSCRVVFTTRGAVPVSWRIIDPVLLTSGAGLRAGKPSAAAEDALGTNTLEMIPLVPGAADQQHPFEFILTEANRAGGHLEAFNRRVYSANVSTDKDGTQVAQFVSPTLAEGLQLTKTFSFAPSGFLNRASFRLINRSEQTYQFEEEGRGPGVVWAPGIGGEDDNGGGGSRSYSAHTTAVWLSGGQPFYEEERSMQLGATRPFANPVQWAGVTNRYFLAALIPTQPADAVQISALPRNAPPGLIKKGSAKQSVEIYRAPLLLKPGETAEYNIDVFVGPKSNPILKSANHDVDQVLFYSSWRWFRGLCLALMSMLVWLRQYLPDYGYSIIALTLIIRLITQPLVHFSMKSNARFMRAQAKLKPELDEIAKKHKDNPQKRNEETWKLYKKHNVNPLGMMKGCFWMMIQMPIFIAFYRLLDASIDLRCASFWWIKDLSQADRLFALPAGIPVIQYFNLLPILMTLTQYLTTKLSTATTTDPTQRSMLYVMPLMFLVMMYNMSSGLVLYWFVSNLWQIGSQAIINRTVKKEAGDALPTAPPAVKPPAKSGEQGGPSPKAGKRSGR